MSPQIVECIPNFSEGRRMEVIDSIGSAITAGGDVHLLDRHVDPDHNRTVYSFVGSPAGAKEAAFRAIAKAAELIDLEVHEGEHPRIGATDVVPFVPISDVTMQDCVELARALGRQVGDELGIPVYLYEKAATRPDRVNLEQIRKGEYEGLKASIATDPDRVPDFGPSKLGKAGATVIGARPPLIAFNVYLNTDEVEIAQKIGKAVRHSSGGLRFVKALGMLVEGQAQVSMNLTDYTRTPVARVVELIRREAARYGVSVQRSELVGLIPQSALIDAAQWYLQLDDFDAGQVLENRLFAASRPSDSSDVSFLEALASDEPTPGGGSAAAYAGAMGAALVEMVARLTIGKVKYNDVEERMREIAQQAASLRDDLTAAARDDAAAFDGVMAAFRLPKENEQEREKRSEAIEQATLHAAEVPLLVAEKAVRTLELAVEVAGKGNLNAISDAGAAGAMAASAFQAASMNVQINLSGIKGEKETKRLGKSLHKLSGQAVKAQQELSEALLERADLSL
jgi:glutamate formiminotransferase/formiminotetrahydrofolate cyclodeaminase